MKSSVASDKDLLCRFASNGFRGAQASIRFKMATPIAASVS
jgi:hypothetical protein